LAINNRNNSIFRLYQISLKSMLLSLFFLCISVSLLTAQEEINSLIGLLGSEDKQIKLESLQKLGELGDIEAVDPIIELLSTESDIGIRNQAIYTLALLKSKKSIPILIDNIDGTSMAIYALGEIGDEKAVDALIQILTKQYDNINSEVPRKQYAIEALLKIGDPKAAQIFREILSDRSLRKKLRSVIKIKHHFINGYSDQTTLNLIDGVVAFNDKSAASILRDIIIDNQELLHIRMFCLKPLRSLDKGLAKSTFLMILKNTAENNFLRSSAVYELQQILEFDDFEIYNYITNILEEEDSLFSMPTIRILKFNNSNNKLPESINLPKIQSD
jgi:HEAT repeat protein